MNCHSPCGACCIAPQITSPLPNMPDGKPAGVRCINLDLDTLRCKTYDLRPQVCRDFKAAKYSCGSSHSEAIRLIGEIEMLTK